ncbi:MAG: sulfite exporter TauE/SafE family protein [Deltaproteobacteria bacterium]|nr:sulfite exporter TauE/SafE family protein [Deltaproteobacteria bacterium]
MNHSHWAVVLVASAIGSLSQGATGFGSAMVAIPIMLWGGMSLPGAIAVNTAIITVQGATSCWQHRATIPWRETNAMVVLRFTAVPLGVLALASMQAWGPIVVKQVVGATLLLILVFLLAFKVKPVARVAPIWTALAGGSSGFLTGAVGMGGPPLVTWTMMHDWEPSRVRGFLWATSLQMAPISLALLVWQFGAQILWFFLVGLLAFPVVALGNRWGNQLGNTLSRQRLRRVTYGLLAFTAAVSIGAPWLSRTTNPSKTPHTTASLR